MLPMPTQPHIYLIHRWDLVPLVLCGIIYVHLRRIIPVNGRGGNVSEAGGSILVCKELERRAKQAPLLWECL